MGALTSKLRALREEALMAINNGRRPIISGEQVIALINEIESLDADCCLLKCERDMFKQQRADWKAVAESRASEPPRAPFSMDSRSNITLPIHRDKPGRDHAKARWLWQTSWMQVTVD